MTHIPRPIQGEFAHGHIALVERLKGTRFSRSSLQTRYPIRSTCEVSGITEQAYVAAHTLVPFVQCARPHRSRHGTSLSHWLIPSGPGPLLLSFGQACKVCIDKDQAIHQRSAWHRSHQIPGIQKCPLDGAPLYVDRTDHWYESPPDARVNSLEVRRSDRSISTAETCYEQVALYFLRRVQPFPRFALGSAIAVRAGELGFRQSENGRGRLISDEVVRLFENQWLETVMPKIREKVAGRYFTRIDQAARRDFTMPAVAYCLAASVLFEDVEHARTYFERHELTVPLAEKGPTDPLSLIRWANGRGAMMARHLRKSEDQTVFYLAAHLDALLESLRDSPEAMALRDFVANGDLRASCKRHGVSPNVGLYIIRIMASEKMGLALDA